MPVFSGIGFTMDSGIYAGRRARLAAQMGCGVALIPTAPERVRNRDAHYPYRHDSYFYYLTGFREPEAVLVILAVGGKSTSTLFCRDRDPERAIWDGFRYGPEGAREHFGFDAAYPVGVLDEHLPGLLADQPAVYCRLGADPAWDARLMAWMERVRGQARTGIAAPHAFQDVHTLLDEMRLIKDPTEVDIMRRAADISAAAHRRAMRQARAGLTENQVEAELLHEFRRCGAQAPAYTPIVAAGPNSCVLHYVNNDQPLREGDLLLVDAGCELDGYASDITRTFPVGGRFEGPRREIYELVLAAQEAAIATVRPGNTWNMPHDAAVRVLAQGFIDLGLLHGELDSVLETESYKKFYMHRTGHWLGMDVHDAGDYKLNGSWRVFEPGMVFTVEPGCYIRPASGAPRHFEQIGVRIEDDVVVTAAGCEVISSGAPKTIMDIEALMRGATGGTA